MSDQDRKRAAVKSSQMAKTFPTTRWSVVLELNVPDRFAELCTLYREPLLAFAQRSRRISAADAEDLVHDFFAQLAASCSLHPGGPKQGLFRSYLLGAFKHHLSNDTRRKQAAKRGGGAKLRSLEGDDLHARVEGPDVEPELAYDRAWALATLMQAMTRVEQSYVKDGRGAMFFALKRLLDGDEESQRQVARDSAVSEAALRVALHRFRRRLSREVRLVVAATVSEVREIESEVQYLTMVLQQSSWSLGEHD